MHTWCMISVQFEHLDLITKKSVLTIVYFLTQHLIIVNMFRGYWYLTTKKKAASGAPVFATNGALQVRH